LKMALFKNLAIALAQDGIASLRCDDRGVGDSTGSLLRASLDTLVGDAAAMVQALRGQPGIDPERIAIIGHAEGAEIAAMVAEKDRGIRALGLLAASGRPLDQVLIADRDGKNRAQGFKDEYIAREHRRLDAVYSAVRNGKPLPESATAEEKQLIAEEQPWLVGHFRHDPLRTLQKLKIPVFVAQGGRDLHVSVKQDAERIRSTLERSNNKRAAYRLYPELSHAFAPAKTGTVSDYSDPDLHVDLEFIGDLVKFFKGSL
jgi:pimeloyl-ACP methyl ester carboxylesterase